MVVNGVASTRGHHVTSRCFAIVSLSRSHSLGNYFSHARTLICSHIPCTLLANTVVLVDFSLLCIGIPIHSNVCTRNVIVVSTT